MAEPNHPFDYHKPNNDQIHDIEIVRLACKILYDVAHVVVPGSAEGTLAIRKLEEFSMWANKAIVTNGRVGRPDELKRPIGEVQGDIDKLQSYLAVRSNL